MGIEGASFPAAKDPERIEANGFDIRLRPAENPDYSYVRLYRNGICFETVIKNDTGEIVDKITTTAPEELSLTANRLQSEVKTAILETAAVRAERANSGDSFWSTPEHVRVAQAEALARQRGDHRPDVD